MKNKQVLEKLMDRTKITNTCWVYMGPKLNHGYGEFCALGEISAHRVSWILHHGKIKKGMYICHSCDNPPCINPKHLWIGTPRENKLDSVKKNRHMKGEKMWKSILNGNQISQIRELRKYGATTYELAYLFKTCRANIYDILNRTWKHIK